jgi:hypothetical protein
VGTKRRRISIGTSLLAALVSATLLARDAGHATAPSWTSCEDAGVSFEQATTARTDYLFDAPGHVVEAEGVAWLGIEGHALELMGSARGCWVGGLVDGPYDDRSVYECTRAHCPPEGCPTPCLAYHTTACSAPESSGGQGIEDLECAHYGDGISRERTSGDVVLRRVHLRDLNDDAVEDDYGLSNTRVLGSLIDGVHCAFGDRQRSSQDNDATGTEWEVRDTLVRVRPNANPYKQRPGHGGFWKGDHDPRHQHRYRLTNNVFVAQDVKQSGLLFPVVGWVDECAGNVLLWAGQLAGAGGLQEALADQRDFADGLSDGERLAALNAAFPGCFGLVTKPEDQSEEAFLATPFAELGGKSWRQLVAEWGTTNAAPSVVISAPPDGSVAAPGNAVAFAASASDAEDGDLSAAIAWRSSLTGPLGSGPSLTLDDLAPGTHLVTAAVTDSGGRSDGDSVSVTIADPNTAPLVVITSPPNGLSVKAGTQVSFAGSAADAEDGDLSASLVWTASKDGPLGTGASLTAALRTKGSQLISASATDSRGVSAQAQVQVRVR